GNCWVVGGGLFRCENAVAGVSPADMAQIAQNADAVHLGDHFIPKAAEPGIAALVATGTRQILGVVGDLSDTHSEILEKRDVANLILKRRGVLKAEDDAGLSFRFGTADVGCGGDWIDQVALLAKPALPPP